MEFAVILSIESLAQLAAGAFVASLWQGILLAAAVALCLRLLPKMTAAVRFAVWSAVFVVILLLPFVHAYAGESHSGIAPAAVVRMDVRWSYAIAAAWASMSLLRAGKLAVGAWRLRRLWKRSTPIPAGVFSATPAIAGSRTVQLCTSTEIDRPSVIGFFSPRILIPEWLYEKLTPGELEQVVIHELGHISRADDWINLFQKIGLVLFPLNPALMWIDRRLCFERELACDDGVLRCTQAPGAYATCLVSLAERTLDRRAASLSLGAWERRSELARRVHSILRRGEGMTPVQARLALGAIVIALLGGAAGLSQFPRIVSFAPDNPVAERPVPMPTPSAIAPEYRPAELRPVAYHPAAAPHETLLKATMLAAPDIEIRPKTRVRSRQSLPANKPVPAAAHAPAAQRAKQIPAATEPVLVLTSWDEPINAPGDVSVRSGVLLTVTDAQHHLSRYAALPIPEGWLVIQL
jgi:Zn-dependent protease with chaperone function